MDPKILVIILAVLVVLNIALLAGIVLAHSEPQCQKRNYAPDTRIVGGGKVSIQAHIFMAAIVIKEHGQLPQDSLQCGCAIIAVKWVVTAAHCLGLMEEQQFTKDVVYISSGHATWKRGKKHDVMDWIKHKHYNSNVMSNDIALILVKEPFTEKPVAIANKRYPYRPNTYAMVTGWGYTKDTSEEVQDVLNGVHVKVLKQSQCKEWYDATGDTVTREMFCAGFEEGGKDACQFDSGGPIVQRNILIGIISWGVDCARRHQPGVYTRISLYQKWITDTTKRMGEPAHAVFKN